ncbi:MAG: uracil phosphoribosyltransferase [Clostridia bacterium]|nr:uracil phosphoribosyltransferase [Clostridia bacterium]
MNNIYIMDHPLVQHKISILRDKNTSSKEFRELIHEITMLMCYESMRNLKLHEKTVETPLQITKSNIISQEDIIFVPILRAGLGMIQGALNLIPNARIGHIGLSRDHETLQPIEYYFKLPPNISSESTIILLDPMLATGGTAVDSVQKLKNLNLKNIKFMCILASPEGINKLHSAHSDIEIYCAAKDQKLNEHGYILPGLGDAGDRIFGTL